MERVSSMTGGAFGEGGGGSRTQDIENTRCGPTSRVLASLARGARSRPTNLGWAKRGFKGRLALKERNKKGPGSLRGLFRWFGSDAYEA